MRVLPLVLFLVLITSPAFNVTALSGEDSRAPKQTVQRFMQTSSSEAMQGNTLIFLPREKEIELALSAGPEHLRPEATVYFFTKDGYQKVRSGKNGFTCMVNRDGNQTGDNDLKPTCWDPEGSATIVPVMLRVGELMAQGKSAEEIKSDIDAGFNQGRFSSPRKAGIVYAQRRSAI